MPFDKSDDIRRLARLAGIDEEKLLKMIKALESCGNDKAIERILNHLSLKAMQQDDKLKGCFHTLKQEDFSGNLAIGMINDVVWKISPDELCRHLSCYGATGAGKTTHAFGLMKRLAEMGVNILSLGVKRDVRHIAISHVPMLVLRFSQRSNFLLGDMFRPPEGVDEIDYQTTVIKSFAQSTFIAEAGESLLIEAITSLRAKQGYVDLISLIDYLRRMKCWSRRMYDWQSTCVNRLTAFNTMFGKMFLTRETFPFEKVLVHFNIEEELDGAGMFKPFFAALPIIRTYKYRIANNIRTDRLLTAIFCDEVNILASKVIENHASALGSLPVLLEYMPLSREFGFGFVLYSNQPSEVSNVLKAQAGIKMSLRLGDWRDIHDIGNCMTLDEEQKKAIVDLPPGVAVVKMQGLNPFPVEIPNFEVEKNVIDEQVDENNRKLVKGTGWEKFFGPDFDMVVIAEQDDEPDEISDIEKAFLFDVYNHPYTGISKRYENLSLSAGKGNRIKKSLVDRALIQVHEINHGGQGGSVKMLEITDKGCRAIGMKAKTHIGRGSGFEHDFWQYDISERTKRIDYVKKTIIEGKLRAKFIDVLIEIASEKLAVEIEMTPDWALENIRKDLNAGVSCVFTAAKDKAVLDKIAKGLESLPEDVRKKVHLCLVQKLASEVEKWLTKLHRKGTIDG